MYCIEVYIRNNLVTTLPLNKLIYQKTFPELQIRYLADVDVRTMSYIEAKAVKDAP